MARSSRSVRSPRSGSGMNTENFMLSIVLVIVLLVLRRHVR